MTTRSSTAPASRPAELHIVLEQDSLKIGTCFHCVVKGDLLIRDWLFRKVDDSGLCPP